MGLFEQFPYTNFHEMNQDWLLKVCRELAEEMAALKADWSDYKTYIDNYFKNLDIDDEIRDAVLLKVNQMAADGTLDSIISNVVARELPEFSAPVFVSGTSGMTDSTKVYVNTANGHVYAYNGTAFYDTGLSYAFDSSLVISSGGVLANNTDLDDLTSLNTVYYMTSSYTYDHAPHFGAPGMLLVKQDSLTTTQIFLGANNYFYSRRKVGSNAWTSWEPLNYGAGRTLANGEDLDDITTPGVYLRTGSSAIVIDNQPSFIPASYGAFVYVYVCTTVIVQQYITFSASDHSRQAAFRYKAVNGWTDWKSDGFRNAGTVAANSDINDYINVGWYWINGNAQMNLTNMPADIPSGSAALLKVYVWQNVIMQEMIKWSDGIICWRSSLDLGSTWRDWRTIAGQYAGGGGLSGKKYIAFGDSITWSSVWSGGTISQASYDDRIPTRIGSACGISNILNMGISNIGYLFEVDNKTILDYIQQTDLTDAALITLACGRNDGGYSLTQIMSALQNCITYIKSQNKTCQIVILQPTPHNHTDGEIAFTETTSGGWSLDSFEAAAKTLAASTGCGYAGWRECSYVWSWASFTGDQGNYAHPNASWLYGQLGAYMGGKVSGFFKM